MKKQIFSITLLMVFLINLISGIPVYAASPGVTTGSAVINTFGWGTFEFNVTANGGYNITDCGVKYGTSSSNLSKTASYGYLGANKGTFSVETSGLSLGTVYYYQAYAINENNETTVGSVKSVVIPGSFSISSPSNGASISYGSDVTVKWSSAKKATEYRLVMRDITAGESSSTQIYKGSSTSYTIDSSDLEGGHEYKIHVQARAVSGSDDNAIWASNGDEYYFSTKLNTPVITIPSSNGTMTLSSPVIKWNSVPDVSMYALLLTDNVTGNELLESNGYPGYFISAGETSCNLANITWGDFSTDNLTTNRSYTLTLRAYGEKDDYYTESSSVVFTLKSDSVPTVRNYDVDNITATSFEATGNIISTSDVPLSDITDCGFYYREYGSSSKKKVSLGEPTSNLFYTTISGLSANTEYQFMSYATNANGEGTSGWTNVTTGNVEVSAPAVSTIGYSKNSDTEYVIKGKVTDNGNSEITSYGFNIGTDLENLNNLYSGNLGTIDENVEFTYTYSNLQPNTTYYYQAFAYNDYGYSEGGISSFTVGNITVPEIISANASPSIISVGDTATFTVKTNTKATKLIMYTETGAIADEWSGSSYYTDNGDERTWTIEREIYSIGRRFLTFKASDGSYVNDTSSATVSVQVTSAGEKIKATITSQKNQSLTVGESYKATWTTDKTAQSYSLFIFYNGNLIRTIKNYRYQYYDFAPSMLSNQGEYAIEVIPYYPGYEATGDTATITVSPSETSTAVIKNIDSTSEVICNVDNFECTVTTNANADKVVLEYELGNRTELTLTSSTATEKTWKISRKLNYIGKRKLTVRAFDSNSKETSPSFVNVDVIPEDINWNLTYDEASGELTIDTSDEISSKLTGAYAKLVVYKNGTDTNLLENSGELALINKGEASSRSWNVFTDLNLVSGETYTFTVSYLSTYAQGFDCGAILENIGTKTISDTEEELPEIYSVDIEIDELTQTYSTDSVSLMSYTPEINYIQGQLGQTVTFTITTNKFVDKLYMLPDNGNIKDAVLLNGTYKDTFTNRVWTVKHTFSGLHANRKFGFYGISSAYGKRSFNKYADKTVTIGMIENTWSGSFSNNVLTVKQIGTYSQHYNDVNMYGLYIKNTETGDFAYYYYDNYSKITSTNLNRKLERSWVIPSGLPLENGVTYEYGIRGGVNLYSNNLSSVDYKIGTFTTNHSGITKTYAPRIVTNCDALQVYAGGYWENPIGTLPKGTRVFVDIENSSELWARIRYGDSYAYIERKYLKTAEARALQQKNYAIKYGTSTVSKSGCALLALTNALYYMDGQEIDVQALATYAGNKGTLQSGGTVVNTLLSVTKNSHLCSFDYNGKNNTNDIDTLINHLKNGGVAIYGVENDLFYSHKTDYESNGYNGHIIAIVDYCRDGDKESFLFLDSESRLSKKIDKKDENSNDGVYWLDKNEFEKYRVKTNNFRLLSPSVLNLMSLFANNLEETNISLLTLICYNSHNEEIERFFVDTSNYETNISVPYSTSRIEPVYYLKNAENSIVINCNGETIHDGDSIEFVEDSLELTADVFTKGEEISSLIKTSIIRSDVIADNELLSLNCMIPASTGQEFRSIDIEIAEKMEITISKSISEIYLDIKTNDYNRVTVYDGENPILEKDCIKIADTGSVLTIIVENELGEEKEYTLTINKESEYESDTTLESIYVSAYDSADEYIDVYTFDSTVSEITGLSENAKTVMINASATSDFATVTYYINGGKTIFEKPISLSSGFVLTVRVTAEDGTYKDYTYTYGEPPVPLTKTTFKNTATYHKFYVTFEEAIDNATIYAAIYDEDGKLLGLETSPCDGDDYYIVNVPVNSDTKKAKIFVWEDNIKPLGYAETLNME